MPYSRNTGFNEPYSSGTNQNQQLNVLGGGTDSTSENTDIDRGYALETGYYNPVGAAGEYLGYGAGTGTAGDLFAFANDPMDLMGYQGLQEQRETTSILTGAAEAGIESQQGMQDRINAMYDPYRQSSEKRFGAYADTVLGGDQTLDINSPQYQRAIDTGTTSINRNMASRGLLGSSGRGAALAELYVGAGQDEAARQYGRDLDIQQMGTDAIGAIGGAEQTASTNVAGAYGQLGQGINTAYQQYGAGRQQSGSSAANALYGAQSYYG